MGFFARDGVVCTDSSTGFPEGLHQRAARCLAHIVGVRFKGQAPERDGLAIEVPAEEAVQLLEHDRFLLLVDLLDGVQQRSIEVMFVRAATERLHVFREARTPVAAARIDEVVPDPRV